MITDVEIEAGLVLAEQIVSAIIKVAPAIQQGVVSMEPYVEAIAGMITGTNVTPDMVNALVAQVQKDSADFQTPLPADDGTTTT